MVGFFIDLNGKTNHTFPVYGIRKGFDYSGFPLRSNFSPFPYPVHGKFMVSFSIQVNEKTNHKFPVTGYGNERKIRTIDPTRNWIGNAH